MVAVLARPIDDAKLPPEWVEPLAQDHMAVVSAVTVATRLTTDVATVRNNFAAQFATRIVVAHASPGGALERLCEQWQAQGLQVKRLLKLSD